MLSPRTLNGVSSFLTTVAQLVCLIVWSVWKPFGVLVHVLNWVEFNRLYHRCSGSADSRSQLSLHMCHITDTVITPPRPWHGIMNTIIIQYRGYLVASDQSWKISPFARGVFRPSAFAQNTKPRVSPQMGPWGWGLTFVLVSHLT